MKCRNGCRFKISEYFVKISVHCGGLNLSFTNISKKKFRTITELSYFKNFHENMKFLILRKAIFLWHSTQFLFNLLIFFQFFEIIFFWKFWKFNFIMLFSVIGKVYCSEISHGGDHSHQIQRIRNPLINNSLSVNYFGAIP